MQKKSKIDFENFKFDEYFEEIKESIKKPNIFICGGTGVGKSSIVNDIFELDLAKVGIGGKPETHGVIEYTTANSTVNLFDSEGYEIGTVSDGTYYDNIISFINKKRQENPEDMSKHIHEVWYCVSAANKRFLDIDKDVISEVIKENVPLMVVVTKVDEVDENELKALLKEIRSNIPNVNCYTYSTEIPKEDEAYEQYVQREDMIQWAIDNLDISLQSGLIPAIKGSIEKKKEYILNNVVTKYTVAAVATVLGTSFIPVPFSDSVALVGIQIKMALDVFSAFGIKMELNRVAISLIGGTAISNLGRMAASQIFSVIPFVGGAAKAAVNTGVAGSITAVIGIALTLVCEKYLKECVDKDGVENTSFYDFFNNGDKFSDAVNYVKKHKDEFGIDKIVNFAIKKNK